MPGRKVPLIPITSIKHIQVVAFQGADGSGLPTVYQHQHSTLPRQYFYSIALLMYSRFQTAVYISLDYRNKLPAAS